MPDIPSISRSMLKMLRCLERGEPHNAYCEGRSQFGGATSVLRAAINRGYIRSTLKKGLRLTPQGRKVLGQLKWRNPDHPYNQGNRYA